MKLLVATDAYIFKTQDGKHWGKAYTDMIFGNVILNFTKPTRKNVCKRERKI